MMRDPDEALMVEVRPLVLSPVTQVEGNQMLMGWLKLSGAKDPLQTHRLHSQAASSSGVVHLRWLMDLQLMTSSPRHLRGSLKGRGRGGVGEVELGPASVCPISHEIQSPKHMHNISTFSRCRCPPCVFVRGL